MSRYVRQIVGGVAMFGATVGCEGSADPSPSPSATNTSAANALCGPAVAAGQRLAGAYETTVGDVRSRTAGPGAKPAASFAPSLGAADAAAWCWIDSSDGATRVVVARAASGEQTTFVRGNPRGLPPNPDGPSIP